MTMVKTDYSLSFSSKKISKIQNRTDLTINYNEIDKKDIYGFYLSNKTTKNNTMQLPDIGSFIDTYPDFMALETEPGLYHSTKDTCICWFKDDSVFDTIDGIYNAIIYKDKKLLSFYKDRYYGVKYFVAPDYSLYGDFDFETLLHNLKKSIIVYLWLTIECNGFVFPLMTYGNKKSLNWCFEHIMIGSNVALSLKGIARGKNKELFRNALKKLIDTRKPKALIVYTVSSDKTTKDMLKYAIDKNVKIICVSNTLMNRNRGNK